MHNIVCYRAHPVRPIGRPMRLARKAPNRASEGARGDHEVDRVPESNRPLTQVVQVGQD
jgi:hypothetical protein